MHCAVLREKKVKIEREVTVIIVTRISMQKKHGG